MHREGSSQGDAAFGKELFVDPNQPRLDDAVAGIKEAKHSCMTNRRVRKPGSPYVASAMRGKCRDWVSSRAEVMELIRRDPSI